MGFVFYQLNWNTYYAIVLRHFRNENNSLPTEKQNRKSKPQLDLN